jgi:hypothetical protein
MAAPGESTGLRIAVAVFVTLSVILSITAFFLYHAYSADHFQLAQALHENTLLRQSQKVLQTQYDELKAQMSKPSESRPK